MQRKVKEAQKEELERQSRAQTNQALGAALGGGARWQKFHARGKAGQAMAGSFCYSVCSLKERFVTKAMGDITICKMV